MGIGLLRRRDCRLSAQAYGCIAESPAFAVVHFWLTAISGIALMIGLYLELAG